MYVHMRRGLVYIIVAGLARMAWAAGFCPASEWRQSSAWQRPPSQWQRHVPAACRLPVAVH